MGLPVGLKDGLSLATSGDCTADGFGQTWTPDVPDVIDNFIALVYHPPTKMPLDRLLLSRLSGDPVVSCIV